MVMLVFANISIKRYNRTHCFDNEEVSGNMKFDYNARQKKLNEIAKVDLVALVPGANMVYHTGLEFHLSERPILAFYGGDGQLSFIIPELEVSKVTNRADLDAQIFSWTDEEGYVKAFEEAVSKLNLDSLVLGVDGMTMRVFEVMALTDAGVTQIKDVGEKLLDIRAIKAQEEIDAMQEAVNISEQALHKLMSQVKVGMTEAEIGSELSRILSDLGSEGEAFHPLVQTGPNSAVPHGNTTDRVLNEGEFLLIDFGGKKQGYPADITRTFCFGEPSDELQKIFDTVVAANEAAIKVAKAGVTCGDVDKAARDVIEAAGYGEYFIHRTGHGLGLEGHELPQIASGVDDKLEVGMVFTVEPGIYVPDLGGVRIEDDVVVLENGVKILTSYPKTLKPE